MSATNNIIRINFCRYLKIIVRKLNIYYIIFTIICKYHLKKKKINLSILSSILYGLSHIEQLLWCVNEKFLNYAF